VLFYIEHDSYADRLIRLNRWIHHRRRKLIVSHNVTEISFGQLTTWCTREFSRSYRLLVQRWWQNVSIAVTLSSMYEFNLFKRPWWNTKGANNSISVRQIQLQRFTRWNFSDTRAVIKRNDSTGHAKWPQGKKQLTIQYRSGRYSSRDSHDEIFQTQELWWNIMIVQAMPSDRRGKTFIEIIVELNHTIRSSSLA